MSALRHPRTQRRRQSRRRPAANPIRLEWIEPREVEGLTDLRAFFTEPPLLSRAALYFRAARSALTVPEEGRGDGPGLSPATIRTAREAAHSILTDVETLAFAAVRACSDRTYRPEFESANAWDSGDRVRLASALLRVVAFDAADADPVLRELVAIADAEIAPSESLRG